VTLLALVMGLAPAAEAGPFQDFFRKVRRTFTQSKKTTQPHKTVHRQPNDTPPKDSIAEDQTTPGPPEPRNTQAARATHVTKATSKDLPYGTPVPGKKGFVTSPFAPDSGYVDVRDFPPGSQVKDPYTGKVFLTP
jgi:hypothetical protein